MRKKAQISLSTSSKTVIYSSESTETKGWQIYYYFSYLMIFKFAVFFSSRNFHSHKIKLFALQTARENLQTVLVKYPYETGIDMNIGHKIMKNLISTDCLWFQDQEL